MKRKLSELEAGYAAMAADKQREAEAFEWIEAMVGDVSDDEIQHMEKGVK